MTDARRFRSAGSGGQRGAPATGSEFQFSGSRGRTSSRLKGILAARRYQQKKASVQADAQYGNSRSIQSPGEISARRAQYRAERSFDNEKGFYDPASEEE